MNEEAAAVALNPTSFSCLKSISDSFLPFALSSSQQPRRGATKKRRRRRMMKTRAWWCCILLVFYKTTRKTRKKWRIIKHFVNEKILMDFLS
jgi:hypothetical protein